MFFSGSPVNTVKIQCIVVKTYGKWVFFPPSCSSVRFMLALSLMDVVILLPAGHSVTF